MSPTYDALFRRFLESHYPSSIPPGKTEDELREEAEQWMQENVDPATQGTRTLALAPAPASHAGVARG